VAVPRLDNARLKARLYAESSGAACVDVRSIGWPPHWYSLIDEVHAAKELGVPGESRNVASCT